MSGLCRDKTLNHISEWSKLAQKGYKTKHNYVGKMIHRELCKRLKFVRTNKLYVHKPESVQENKTHKILWDFEIQTDHLIQTTKSDLVFINIFRWILLFQRTKEWK